ncbi:MAG: nitroreductase [Candidatus Latescibacteria bacterium]|nr:nitroreductase [Candidatus Latescibacterota bacterium]MBT4137544.1 nitroreductase [Candidatus Latescibacterota bacterium]
MDVMEAIRSRRSIFKFKPEPVAKDVIARIFEAGIWAPNHHLTEPWRFVVIGEETKEILAQRYSEIQEAKAAAGASDEARKTLKDAGYAKFMSKPTIVAVVCLQDGDDIKKREDYAATCCAAQNVALAAWAEGVGMQWSTGPITLEDNTYKVLGIDPETEYTIGFFYTGYPVEVPQPRRKPLAEVLSWTD